MSIDQLLLSTKLVVVPWSDPVVEAVGYEARSGYVELFWLNVLGPSATWILRRLAAGFDAFPGGYELDLPSTASALGLSFSNKPNSPFTRALKRCVWFGIAQPLQGGLAVRQMLPPVSHHQLARMPLELQQAHEAWINEGEEKNSTAQQQRATALAQVMLSHGDDAGLIESQLIAVRVAPGVAAVVTAQVARRHAATAQS